MLRKDASSITVKVIARFFFFLGLALWCLMSVLAQNAGQSNVRTYDTLQELLSSKAANSTPAVLLKGVTAATNYDGFILVFNPNSTQTADNVNVFEPTNGYGRWYRVTGLLYPFGTNSTLITNWVINGNATNFLSVTNVQSITLTTTNYVAIDAPDLYLSIGSYWSNLLSTNFQNVLVVDPNSGKVDFKPNHADNTIATSTLLGTVDPALFTNVVSLGRAAVGDGGGGRFWYVSGAPLGHVNNGTVWRGLGDAGNWYYDLNQAKSGLNVLLWENVGNRGGDITCDAGLSNALRFCYAPTYGPSASQTNFYGLEEQYAKIPLLFPPGIYTIGTITNHGVGMYGAIPGVQEANGTRTNGVVIFQQKPGTVGPMIVADRYGFTLSGITMKGSHERTASNLQTVTNWVSRLQIEYDGSNPNASTNDNYAFFYEAGTTNYKGSAALASVGSNTATLVDGEDLIDVATYPGASAWNVRFSPLVTIGSTTGISPALAGNPALLIYGETIFDNTMDVRDCFIDGFHTGIAVGPNSAINVMGCSLKGFSWAAISSVFTTEGLQKSAIDKLFVDGWYYVNGYGTNVSGSANYWMRNGRYGIYGANEGIAIGDGRFNGIQTGIAVNRGPFSASSVTFSITPFSVFRFQRSPDDDQGTDSAYVGKLALYSIPAGLYINYNNPDTLHTIPIRLLSDFNVSIGLLDIPLASTNDIQYTWGYYATTGRMAFHALGDVIHIDTLKHPDSSITHSVSSPTSAQNAPFSGTGLFRNTNVVSDSVSMSIGGTNAFLFLMDGGLFSYSNTGSTNFRVATSSGYTGGGTNYLSDDGTYKTVASGTTINPSDGYIPVRSSSTTFTNSPLVVVGWNKMTFGGANFTIESVSGRSIGIGEQALQVWPENQVPGGNVAIGESSLASTSGSAYQNTAIGANTLSLLTSGIQNTAIGIGGLSSLTSGNFNLSLGDGSGLKKGDGNVFIGVLSGGNYATNYYNVFLGYNSDVVSGSPPTTNSIVIGSNTRSAGSNTAMIGTNGVSVLYLNGTVGWFRGSGSPIGVLTNAPVGSFYSNETGGAGSSFYVVETTVGNWVPK